MLESHKLRSVVDFPNAADAFPGIDIAGGVSYFLWDRLHKGPCEVRTIAPGIPEGARESIFERFHSDRPEEEAFGQHSGLGLSIARTIVNGHGGRIEVAPPMQGIAGARLIVRLPSARLARS